MLTLNSVSYTLPVGKRLFENVTFTLNSRDKAALIGNNGVGKSSLLNIISGESPTTGSVASQASPYYIPQMFGQFDQHTVAQALRVSDKLHALDEILNGKATEHNLAVLDDDWSLENRITEALGCWNLPVHDLSLPLSRFSGGEKTKIFLAGMMIHSPKLILLDEPTNHLDVESRRALYHYVKTSTATMLVSSHDRTLLNLCHPVLELSPNGVAHYGGNYEFYAEQKKTEVEARQAELNEKEAALRRAKEKERDTLQRQKKLDARGKGKQVKAGLPTILQNTLKNSAERSTAKIKEVHAGKIADLASDLRLLRQSLPVAGKMKLNIDPSRLHIGKVLFEGIGINFQYNRPLWNSPINIRICSSERWHICGPNGSGKSSLLGIVQGRLRPHTGAVKHGDFSVLYIDQQYSMINGELTIYEHAHRFNEHHLEEHEINLRLNRFLFPKDTWQKRCKLLSGGERMRLMLCFMNIAQAAPDMIILDEPTNNLDIQSVSILTAAINAYRGTLMVVSHDEHFIREVDIQQTIDLSRHWSRPSC